VLLCFRIYAFMRPRTSPEESLINQQAIRNMIEAAHLTQGDVATLLSESTGRPCSLRSVSAWLSDPSIKNHVPCPTWAVKELKAALIRKGKL
jgi:hypothetical protein